MPTMSDKRNPWITAAVVVVCLVSVLLILAVPAESLVVDLVYQGF
jgi:hypothetical protein